jgi:hypothetical protein
MAWICPCGKSNGDDWEKCRACRRPLYERQATNPTESYPPPPPPNYPQQQRPNSYPPQPPQFVCKTCDQGALVQKKVFRMSGPAVAIGFILLVPSVVGMLFSAFVLISAMGYNGNESNTAASQVSAFDATFRRNCAQGFRRGYRESGVSAPPQIIIEQYCECALPLFKETGSEETAVESCMERGRQGLNVYPVASGYDSGSKPETRLARVLGTGVAIFMGISSFVGGLLGWLLVMRKRVLQCSLCRAVVNAS